MLIFLLPKNDCYNLEFEVSVASGTDSVTCMSSRVAGGCGGVPLIRGEFVAALSTAVIARDAGLVAVVAAGGACFCAMDVAWACWLEVGLPMIDGGPW